MLVLGPWIMRSFESFILKDLVHHLNGIKKIKKCRFITKGTKISQKIKNQVNFGQVWWWKQKNFLNVELKMNEKNKKRERDSL